MSLLYLDERHFQEFVYELVEVLHRELPSEPLPDYRRADAAGLNTTLAFVRDDRYYATIFTKAAYLLVSIALGHFYANGNKRLAYVTALTFLQVNGYRLHPEWHAAFRELLIRVVDSQGNGGLSFQERLGEAGAFLKEHTIHSKPERNLWNRLLRGLGR